MFETSQDKSRWDRNWNKTDTRILGQILAAQSIIFVLPDMEHIAGFFVHALISIPGVISCRVCLGDASAQVKFNTFDADICHGCEISRKKQKETVCILSGFKCKLPERPDIRVIALETLDRTFGFFVFKIDTTGTFESYQPFVHNLANYIALFLEHRLQKCLLQKSYTELEYKIEKRTEELKNANEQLKKKMLEQQEAEKKLHASIKEKDFLLQELNHRVNNNLQLISNMLSLQRRYIRDKNDIALIDENQNRIRSIALVHEKLYLTRGFSTIDLSTYISDLANSIFRSFVTEKSDIKLKVDVENIPMEIERAVTCGLIINELLSNSLKYAFPDGRGGRGYGVTA